MQHRSLIGIPAWSQGENSFGVGKAYLDHISHFGDPIMLCPMHSIIENLDLVILPGGMDLPSHYYDQAPGYFNTYTDPYKEFFINKNVRQYIDAGVPIYGTCLGFQQLIVMYGGSLIQDLQSHAFSGKSRDELVHRLIFTDKYKDLEARLTEKSKVKEIHACSLHHQGARAEQIPECFDIVAITEDGIVEAIIHKELPIAAGQFHIEEDWNKLGMHLIRRMLKQSAKNINNNDRINKRVKENIGDNIQV